MKEEKKSEFLTKAEKIPVEKSENVYFMLPEDAYECKITAIEEFKKSNNISHKEDLGGMFYFEVIAGPAKGRIFKSFFTAKLTKRSKLTILCRAIWGDEFTPEEMAQISVMADFRRFLLNKPLKVILLIKRSYSDSFYYDVAFFLKSEFYNEEINKVILPVETK